MPGPYTSAFDYQLQILSHLGGYSRPTVSSVPAEEYNKLVGVVNDVVSRKREQFDIRSFGADTSNTGSQNRTAILLAIDAAEAAVDGGEVVIPPGEFLIAENPSVGATNAASFSLKGTTANISFRGLDPQRSILKMEGATVVKGGAWYLFQIWDNSLPVYYRDLVIDGYSSSFTNPNEQIHGIQMGFTGGAGLYAYNCEFRNFVGDGIRNGGEVSTPAEDIAVVNCRFIDNDRSGIGVQRNCNRWLIAGNYFYGTNDQDIDFEPTGTGGDTNFIIVNNICKRRPDRVGTASITLTGNGDTTDSHRRSVFANNVLDGGNLDALNLQYSVIANNVVFNDLSAGGQSPAVHLRKYMRSCVVSNNVIVQKSIQPGLQLAFHTSSAPEEMVISDNVIHVFSQRQAILVDGVGNMNISNNICIYDESLPTYTTRGIAVDAGARRVDNISVHDNTLLGAWNIAIGFGSLKEFSNISVYNNSAPQSQDVVEFTAANSSYMAGDYPLCYGNKGGISKVIDGFNNIKVISVGGNVGNTVSGTTNGVVQLQSSGHPGTLGVTAPLGSICFDITAASGTVLFIRESGANNNWSPV